MRKSPSRACMSHGNTSGVYSHSVGVFVYHWAFMAAFALCCMHVQVATRYPWGSTSVNASLMGHMPCHSMR